MIEYKTITAARDYYIIFDRRRGDWMFWHLFTGKKYAHVYLLTESDYKSVIALTPTPSECIITEWHVKIDEAVQHLCDDGVTVLKYTPKYNSLKRYKPYGIISCVSFVKYILGIGGFTFTPARLYRQLIKLGALEYGK